MSTFEFILALLGSDVAVGLATFLLMRRANLRKHSAETDAKVIDNDKNGFETYRLHRFFLWRTAQLYFPVFFCTGVSPAGHEVR